MANQQIILFPDFYKELGEKLIEYKNNPSELFNKAQEVLNDSGVNQFNLAGKNNITETDPFTVFALFNRFNMTENHRIKIMESVKKVFGLKSKVPNSFPGLPLILPLNTRFYSLKDEPLEDIKNLWKFYIAALNYSHDQSDENKEQFIKFFNKCLNIKGTKLSKLTIGLFWLNPDFYISFDNNNTELFYSKNIPENLRQILPEKSNWIDGNIYLKFNEEIHNYLKQKSSPFENALELSSKAWENKISNSTREKEGEALGDEGIETVHYWTYSPGAHASKWEEFYEEGIMAIGWGEIGDLEEFDNKNSIRKKMRETFDESRSYKNSAYAAWQFVHEMKPGDVIFAKNGVHEVVGRGIVDSNYIFDPNVEDEFKNIRKIKWMDKGNWNVKENLALKTLTDITDYTNYVDSLNNLFVEDSEPIEPTNNTYPEYSKDNFLEEVYLSEDNYETLNNLLQRKKNLILVGPPGTGKTFASKRLAYSLIGEKNAEQVEFIQFHQSYSYEDFIMGFRPNIDSNGFVIKNGPFYEFCKQAEIDSDNDYFFIIDEINRGNLSKIFGELFILLEADKRETNINLLYSDEKFKIPKNVYLIGMMNTADRSLALIDYALRRRFAFFEFNPAFDSEGFKAYQDGLNNEKFNRLIQTIKQLNEVIKEDDSLGKGFQIGHSYFCSLENESDLEKTLENIITYEIIPLLEEYWYDEPSKVDEWKARLNGALA